MHHFVVILILLLPVIGIGLFWLLPLAAAVPAYLGILVACGFMYWGLTILMRRQPSAGDEALPGTAAVVVSKLKPGVDPQYVVKVRGELWNAKAQDDLKPGDSVKIVSAEGLLLTVAKTAP